MKRILSMLIAVMMLFMFAACDDSTAVPALDQRDVAEVNIEMATFLKDFVSVHNKVSNSSGGKAEYVGAAKITEAVSTISDMYVNLGAAENVTSVTLLGHEYAEDDDAMAVSIGMNVFYREKAWKMEDGNLMVNKAALLFSILAGTSVEVNGMEYDGYAVISAETKPLSAEDVKYGDAALIAEDGVYTVDCTDSTTLLSYDYDGSAAGDLVYVVTKENDAVTGISILTKDAADFGTYPVPYNQPLENTDKTLVKEYTVLDSTAAYKGTFTLNVHVTATAAAGTEG